MCSLDDWRLRLVKSKPSKSICIHVTQNTPRWPHRVDRESQQHNKRHCYCGPQSIASSGLALITKLWKLIQRKQSGFYHEAIDRPPACIWEHNWIDLLLVLLLLLCTRMLGKTLVIAAAAKKPFLFVFFFLSSWDAISVQRMTHNSDTLTSKIRETNSKRTKNGQILRMPSAIHDSIGFFCFTNACWRNVVVIIFCCCCYFVVIIQLNLLHRHLSYLPWPVSVWERSTFLNLKWIETSLRTMLSHSIWSASTTTAEEKRERNTTKKKWYIRKVMNKKKQR